MTKPSLLELAHAVAQKYPVFALQANKQPLEGGRGFKDATRDPAEIERQFTRPSAALIGVPTGHVSGLFVLDVDPDGLAWFRQNRERFPVTRVQKTRRGGYHVVMRMPAADLRCSAGKVAPGVDVRANGGYVVWWRAEGYDIENHEALGDVPAWLAEATHGGVPVTTVGLGRISAADAAYLTGTAPTVDPFANLKPRCNLTPAQSRSLFPYLDMDSYDGWVQLGQALEHEYGEDGLALWVEASQASDKFPGEDECAKKWASFGRQSGPPVTMRAIINAAKRTGAKADLWTSSAPKPATSTVAALTSVPAAERRKFRIVRAVDYMEQQPPGWIVKGIIPKADLGLVYAGSGAGKTFWVADLTLHMAAGLPYRERPTKRQRVLYVCAEGARGFSVRLRAISQHKGIDAAAGGFTFDVMTDVPSLLDPEQVSAVIEAAQSRPEPYDIVVVDTLAQVTAGGDENSAEDMGRAITASRAIGLQLGAMVILVHHAGKDATRGARGWSGLRAAVDFEVEILRNEDVRSARLSKQKDGSDGDELYFKLVPHPVGVKDEDGNEAVSCHVEHTPKPDEQVAAARAAQPSGANKLLVWRAALELRGVTDREIPYGEFRGAARMALPLKGDKADRRLERADEATAALIAEGFLELIGAEGNQVIKVNA